MIEQETIGIMPRPRIFITILVWVVSCFCLLAIWQAPPQMSSSSLLSSSSSSFSSSSSLSSGGGAPEDVFVRRLYQKPVRRTHVSNLHYLQKREKESKTSSDRSRPSGTLPPIDNSYLHHKDKPYSKISFRNRSPKGSFSASSPESSGRRQELKDAVAPLSDPITYHRSRIKDITDTKDSSPSDNIEERERKKILVQRHKLESQSFKTQRDRGKRKDTQKKNKKKKSKKNWTENYDVERSKERNKNTEKDDENYASEYESGQGEEEGEDEYYDDEYDEYDDDEEEDDEETVYLGGRFNVTPPDATMLIYNRVPKCASSTMQTILRRLSRQLNFEHVSSLIYDHHQLTQDDQEKLLENLTASLTAAPSHTISYDRHLYYTNLTGLGLSPSPAYVNIVRDPVERFISSFYYRRSEERLTRIQQHGKPVSPSLSWVNRTVEQCILLNDTECTFVPGDEKETMLSYFCGHHEFCRIVGNQDAIQAAKQIVSKEYSVVGLVEHMDLSLLLLETLVPRFMEGALQIYENIRQKEHMAVNVNQQKPKVSLVMREELSRRMSDDLDFYYFLEQRLFEQKRNFLSQK